MAASRVAAVNRAGLADACERAEKPSALRSDSKLVPHTLAGETGTSSALASGACVLGSSERKCASRGSSRAACSPSLPSHNSATTRGHCHVKNAPLILLPQRRQAADATFYHWCATRIRRARWRLCIVSRQGAWAALQRLRGRRRRSVAKRRSILLLHVRAAALRRRLATRQAGGYALVSQIVHMLQTVPHQASAVACGFFSRVRREEAHAWKRVQYRALWRRDECTAGHLCKAPRTASNAAGATSGEAAGQLTFAWRFHAYAWERAGGKTSCEAAAQVTLAVVSAALRLYARLEASCK